MINQANIIRDNRKNVKILISPAGELFVYAPKRLNIEKLKEIIDNREDWIKRKISYIKEELEKNQYLLSYKDILLYGKSYSIEYSDNIKKIKIDNDKYLFPNSKKDKFLTTIKSWYKKLANQIIIPRLEQLAQSLNLSYTSAKIIDTKSKWGSCDNKRTIKINYKVIMLPHNLIDFILIHELIHLIELNHSKQYFAILSKVLPDWKKRRVATKKYSFLLKLYK